ncbi:Bug family tripartite tricarboxylate transporter substrate binding protein [Ancylobacter oerskovii]|uniref:Bug family tripartite tricarboxylate transporter substrate binding protein n=1 Tax=Ancylobacter oerskovii TaxID=459519 RepID=A0ABW4YZP6_9HYPH|nr:tripartite tricarboxylate transporter substrate-binding protein [Ancylobacter oerskovii]MBS7543825.1 tripartite tricarboxylate transporter substrate binding protein [Ancylobacter oerskovii]
MKHFAKGLFAFAMTGVAIFAAPAVAEFKGLEIIAPGGPGSGQDQAARAMADALAKDRLASNVQVVNIPGGGGMIALSQFVTSKENNNHAVLTQGFGHVIFPISNKSPVSLADVKPLALLAGEYEVMVVPADSPLKSIDDVIARFKADPGKFIWGGGSAGSTENIFYALIAKQVGMDPKKVNFLPHANTGEIITSVLGKQVNVGGGGYQDFAPQIEAGKLRIIAVASPERLPGIDAPTLKEKGIDVVLANWRGVSVHKSLTDKQTAEVAAVFDQMVKSPRWQQIMKERGWLDLYKPSADYAVFLEGEQKKVREILVELGLAQ